MQNGLKRGIYFKFEMGKEIKLTDTKREVMKKLLSGEATLKNPYADTLLELWDAIGFLKRNKQKVPKLLKELAEEVHKKNMSWKPF